MGTEKEQKNTPPPQNPREKIKDPELSHWLHEISISKTVCYHFQPGLLPPL
jgi:hypothetical protein